MWGFHVTIKNKKYTHELSNQYLCSMELKEQPLIYFAPLQESTDYVYRRAHARLF